MNMNSLVHPELEAAFEVEQRKKSIPVQKRDETDLYNVNVLEEWPDIPHTGMDISQRDACHAMLTKRVAIIQGPPPALEKPSYLSRR